MRDILERLRDRDGIVLGGLFFAVPAMQEAAAEIERLRAAVAECSSDPNTRPDRHPSPTQVRAAVRKWCEEKRILPNDEWQLLHAIESLRVASPSPTRAEMVEALRKIEEVINEIKETSAPMPHVYRQGWQDACEKVRSEVYRSFGRVDGVVREVAAAARVAQLEKGLWSLLELKADCDSERLLEMVQQHTRAILTKADSDASGEKT